MGSRKEDLKDVRAKSSQECEPIAIVGMGCRWPGDCTQPSEMWDLLQNGRDAYSEFPSDRISVDSFYDEKRNRPGSFYTRGGCFLKANPQDFDPTFFGILPQEAISIDPAQRKLLETVYEAFESAGVPLEKISGTRTGCFVGNFNYDHQLMQYRDPEYPEPYSVTGGGVTILSNRVNYVFNLHGPSMTLDTACSSSLYALHHACLALSADDCDGAIVAGSNLILTPESQLFSSNLGAVSPTSRCHTFDASADGYARADGIGVLYLKMLSKAIEDGDPVRAVIRGTSVNSNGKTGGISHPSQPGQEMAIRRAYDRAGLDPASTTYVECHGTGTVYGDPLEVAAVGEVFAKAKSSADPLLIGSVKTNLGHSEPTSGIAGIMKTVLALEHGIIPPIVGLQKLNPNVDLKNGRIKIVTELTPWPNRYSVHRASVNSFGYGGANAHVVLESVESIIPGYLGTKATKGGTETYRDKLECDGLTNSCNSFHGSECDNMASKIPLADSTQDQIIRVPDGAVPRRSQFLLIFSAHDERTLLANIAAVGDSKGKWKTSDLAHTLGVRRSRFRHRAFAISDSVISQGTYFRGDIPVRKIENFKPPTLGFVMTGQGAQWPGMGRDLMAAFPAYLTSIRRLDSFLNELEDKPAWLLEDVLEQASEDTTVMNATISQPATTATQMAIVDLLKDWNIEPSLTIGHSSGEIAAAYAAGRLTARNAIVIAYLRGLALSRNSQDGAMLAVGITESAFTTEVKIDHPDVAIACYNSPENLTLSGSTHDILAVKKTLDHRNIFARMLATDGNAYHSSHMKSIGPDYEDRIIGSGAQALDGQVSTRIPFLSTVTAKDEGHNAATAHYWRSNLERPVLFRQALETMIHNHNVDVLIEIGPHSALRSAIQQISKSAPDVSFPGYLPTLIRDRDGARDILNTSGNLFINGFPIDISRVNGTFCNNGSTKQRQPVIVDLPRYQWQYDKPLFKENRWTREWRLRRHPRHDLLGSRVPGCVRSQQCWRNIIRVKDVPWLLDHVVQTQNVFPAAGYLSMAVEAVTQSLEIEDQVEQSISNIEFRNVSITAALLLPASEDGVELVLTLNSIDSTWLPGVAIFDFVVTSVMEVDGKDCFTEHAQGRVYVHASGIMLKSTVRDLVSISSRTPRTEIRPARWYQQCFQCGLQYGNMFQLLTKIHSLDGHDTVEAEVKLILPSTSTGGSRFLIHPTTLDTVLQLSIMAPYSSALSSLSTGFVPVEIQKLTLWPQSLAKIETLRATVRGSRDGPRTLLAESFVSNINNESVLEIDGLRLRALHEVAFSKNGDSEPFSRLTWKPAIDFLTTKQITSLYPPKRAEISPDLDELAINQLIIFQETYPEFFSNGSQIPHLNRFLHWIRDQTRQVLADQAKISHCSTSQRLEVIKELTVALKQTSSEGRIMCHMYENLPAIFEGQKTGIQVALQGNLLSDLYENGDLLREGNLRLAQVVALYSHQNPGMAVLEVGAGTGSATREILETLDGSSTRRKYSEYVYTDITPSFLSRAEEQFSEQMGVTFSTFDMEKPSAEQGFSRRFDLIVASNAIHATTDILTTLRNIRGLLKDDGKLVLLEITRPSITAGLILGTFSDFWKAESDPNFPRAEGPFLSKRMWQDVLPQSGYSGLDLCLDDFADQPSSSVLVSTAVPYVNLPKSVPDVTSEKVTLIHRGVPSRFVQDCLAFLRAQDIEARLHSTSSSPIPSMRRLIILVDIETPLLDNCTGSEWQNLQKCVVGAESALWVTNGGLLHDRRPHFAMAEGLVRGLKTERQDLRISTLDLDLHSGQPEDAALEAMMNLERKTSMGSNGQRDWQYRQKNGITHISRLVSDDRMNERFREKQARARCAEQTKLSVIGHRPLQVKKDIVAHDIPFYLEDKDSSATPLQSIEVEVKVRVRGFSEETLSPLFGDDGYTPLFSSFAGEVVAAGDGVDGLTPGANVYGLQYSNDGNIIRLNSSCCRSLTSQTSLTELVSFTEAFCHATYALVHLASLQRNERVLIHASSLELCLAAFQVVRSRDAEIYFAVETAEEQESLLNHLFDLQPENVFLSSNVTYPSEMLLQTKSRGIDVIFSTNTRKTQQDYSSCLANFGRLIHTRSRRQAYQPDVIANITRCQGSLLVSDLARLTLSRPNIIEELLAESQHHWEHTAIAHEGSRFSWHQKIPGMVKTPISARRRVIDFNNREETVDFRESKYDTRLDPEASYILVGCLGGLGRHISKWMVSRGAQNLVYLSRSAETNDVSGTFLAELARKGVSTKICKGNVGRLTDVAQAVALCDRPIKGAIHAALTLHDGLYENMSLEDFNMTVKARVDGTVNLHTALEGCSLDFFLTLSSWTSVVGTPAQSNYLASNSFMDAFACYRRSLGLPATSLGLSQILDVGAVNSTPKYQIALEKHGLYGNSEADLLDYCDSAISDAQGATALYKQQPPSSDGHLLAGVEARGLLELGERTPLKETLWYGDRRFSHLTHAIHLLKTEHPAAANFADPLEEENLEGTQLLQRIHKRIAQLLYTPLGEIDIATPINAYGIDSMIAAELRNWLNARLRIDVPLLTLLSPTTTINSLSELAESARVELDG